MPTAVTNPTPVTDLAEHRPAPAWTAPTRFDIHQVPAFERWIAETIAAGRTRALVRCSAVRFIDVAAIEAVDRAADAGLHLQLVEQSSAVRITLQLLAGAQLVEVAA